MRTGAYGAICVIVALTASILGGYLLNAQTTTVCETEFDYVTDIAGAFEGSTGDVEMDYNPAANVTGWSTSPTFNDGYMSGVNFTPASPNSYFIYGEGSGPSTTETDTITIRSITENGVSRWQAVSANKGVVVDDLDCTNMRIAEPGAIAPAEQLQIVHFFDLVDVMRGYSYTDYETLKLTMSISFPGNWPGITYDDGLHYHYKTSRHPAYYTYDGDPVEEATVYGKSSVVSYGETSEPLPMTKVGFIGSFTIGVKAQTASVITYVDPSVGIRSEGSSNAYWNNNQKNISTEIVFTGTDLGGQSLTFSYAELVFYSENHLNDIMLEQANNNWWIYRVSGDPNQGTDTQVEQHFLGKWPAMSMTIESGNVVMRPVSNFVSFSSYTVVDSPTVYAWDILEGEDLLYFELFRDVDFNADECLRMQVMNTKVRIVEGGLYLQNGAFAVTRGFPDIKAFKLTLGSAAHVGDSVTVSGSSGTATIEVADNGSFVIDGKEIPFGQCAIMWVSSTMPTSTIEGTAYPAALYQNGQSYAASSVWISTPTGIVEIGEVGDDPTVTLDGLWAPAVYFYTGDNDAGAITEFVDFTDGVFKWDKNQLILVLMGMSVGLGLAGSYFGYARMVDWIIIIAVNAGAWMLL